MKDGEGLGVGLSADHDNLTRKLLKRGFPDLLGFLPDTVGEGHRGFDLAFLAHGALEMYPRVPIRKNHFDRHGVKGTVTRVGGVPTVSIGFCRLSQEGHLSDTAKRIIGGSDRLGGGGGITFRIKLTPASGCRIGPPGYENPMPESA